MIAKRLHYFFRGSCRFVGFVAHVGCAVGLHRTRFGSSLFVSLVAHIGRAVGLHFGGASRARLRGSGAGGGGWSYFSRRGFRRASAHLGGSGRSLGLRTETANEEQRGKKAKNAFHGW
jgi:hypothetical protein